MQSITYNLRLTQVILTEIDAYLLSREIFWPISGSVDGRSFPRMTFGTYLLTRDELQVLEPEMTPAQEAQHRKMLREADHLLARKPVAVQAKAEAEAAARFNLWKAYIDDLAEGIGGKENYAHEVRNRVMLARLEELAGASSAFDELQGKTRMQDQRLAPYLTDDRFVWDARLEAVYPRTTYRYLYRTP